MHALLVWILIDCLVNDIVLASSLDPIADALNLPVMVRLSHSSKNIILVWIGCAVLATLLITKDTDASDTRCIAPSSTLFHIIRQHKVNTPFTNARFISH